MSTCHTRMRVLSLLLVLLVQLAAHPIASSTEKEEDEGTCKDGVHNVVVARSDLSNPKPAIIKHFSGTVYTTDFEPSCHQKRATVLLPGWVVLKEGELHVPKKYDLIKDGVLKLTVKGSNFDDPLCIDGISQYIALPHSFCTVNLCKFIGYEKCELLQEPGVHTIKELEEKLGFNSTLALPEPPSLLGISLLDLFSGEFSFGFTLESEGEAILDVKIPVNDKFLQIGVTDE
ncbi:hypothetical protein M3Y99_00846300 [Aphelenchoides fujianensis]|nr:hypothetical protein M3Y99_00846300 [Aphelenchoides fujianensis]